MRRGILISLGSLFLCSIVSAGDSADDLKKMQGKWVIKSVERGGDQPPKALLKMTITISGNKLTMELPAKDNPDGKGVTRHFTIRLDVSKHPKEIDLASLQKEEKGDVIPGIYTLGDGEFRLCLQDYRTGKRPTEMKSPKGSSIVLQVMKRP
jgi:uncharacterized protein (TIGR03067 family)